MFSVSDTRVHGGRYFQKECSIKHRSLVTRASCTTTSIQMIGKGGYGTIYVVKPSSNTVNEIPLVKKVTPFDNSKEALHMKRMQGSKHVATLVSYHITPTSSEIIMEYCEKGSIEQELKEHIILPERRVQQIMKSVFQTLAQCHYQDIIHGDVKPDNFLVTNDNRIVAIDFGNSGCERHFEHSKGTPHYMAPEQLRYETHAKSDIWSAGVMMYRLLCGQFPFQDRSNPFNPSIGALWKEIFTMEPRFKEYTWKECSSESIDLLKKILEKDVTRRWSALEVLQHSWFQFDSNEDNNSIKEKRNIRYHMMTPLQKEMYRYISRKLEHVTPEDLSASPNDTIRNQSIVMDYVKEFYKNVYPDYQMDNVEWVQIQGLLKKESILNTLEESDIIQLWSKPKLSLKAF